MQYALGDVCLDLSRQGVYRDDTLVPLEPKLYAVLVYLVQHRNRVVTRDELLHQVWGELYVDTSVISRSIGLLRRVLDGDRTSQRVIQTRRGLGYQFVAEVTETSTAASPAAQPSTVPLSLPMISAEPPTQACHVCQMVQAAPYRFCTACGASQEVWCATCGQVLPASSAFCPACGQRRADLSAVSTDGTVTTVDPALPPLDADFPSLVTQSERKPISVLCAVWDDELVAHWDLDHLPERLAAVAAWVDQVLGAFGGTILALERTSLQLGFGVPVAQEEHAMRALAAADTLRQRASDLPLAGPAPLVIGRHLRLAVSTGLSVVATGFSTTQPSRVFGEVAPEAQHLAAQATPGTLVVNAAMAQLIHPLLPVEPSFSLANEPPASGAYRVAAAAIPHLSRPVHPARVSSPFVGRDDDLAFLHSQLRQVRQGHGQVLGIMAEAGMGKSRLLDEFHQSLTGQAITYLRGRCQPYGLTALYEPFLDLVRQCCQISPGTEPLQLPQALNTGLQALGLDPSALGAYLGHVLGLPEETPLLRGLGPRELQKRVFEAMHQVFLHSAQHQPLVLEIEDIHWIAQSPEAYLSSLAERVTNTPLLLLLSYRPEHQPNWLSRARVTQLSLGPLLPEDSARVVQAQRRQEPLSANAFAEVLRRAQGNPLFLEELTQGAADDASGLDGATSLPPTLQAIWSARLDRVPSDARRLLQLAAVIGHEVPYTLMRALMKLPEPTLHACLEMLHMHELLFQTQGLPEVVYGFKHALTREAAYDMLRQPVRQDLHREVGRVLENAFPEMVLTQPEVLAHHYTEAGMTAQAISYWQEAGQRATDHFAYPEAVAHFRKGLELLQTQPETSERMRRELQLLLLLGPTIGVVQGLATPQREQYYARAHALSQQVGDVSQLAAAGFGLGQLHYARGELYRTQALGEQLLAQIGARADPSILIKVHSLLAVMALNLGELTKARHYAGLGIALYTEQASGHVLWHPGDFHPGMVCYMYRARALTTLGYAEQGWESARRGRALARALADPLTLVNALYNVAVLHIHHRHWREVEAQIETAFTLAREHGSAFWLPLCTHSLGQARVMLGQYESGLAMMAQGLADGEAIGQYVGRHTYLVELADALRYAGQPAQGLRRLAEAQQWAKTMPHGYHKEAEMHRVHGELLLALPSEGSEAEAEACFLRALEVARRQQAKSWELRAALSLSRLWQQQNKCQQAYDLLVPIYEWFTEGFDALDLQEAQALLRDLASQVL